MTGIYVRMKHNDGKTTILPLRNVIIRAYDPNRDDEHWCESQDVIYGPRAESSFFRFIKKYIDKGWELRYYNRYYGDEHLVIGAKYQGKVTSYPQYDIE